VEAPPLDRPDLPQFEDVSDAAAVTAAKASAWERVHTSLICAYIHKMSFMHTACGHTLQRCRQG
jgi:hypothetical protein